MEINLLRHGRPEIDTGEWIIPVDFNAWMKHYDQAGVSDKPPQQAISKSRQCNHIICSDLKRSLHSAELLEVVVDRVDPTFREAGLPSLPWRRPEMAAGSLSILARAAWVCGYSRDCESYWNARSRAEEGTERLIELASSHEQVLLIGHGMMNRLIGGILRKRRWRSIRTTRVNRYWGISTYHHETSLPQV